MGIDRVEMHCVNVARTEDLSTAALASLRRLLKLAYGSRFDDHDWDHAVGGTHFLIAEDGEPISHASVVERRLQSGDREFHTGFVEAVATRPACQRRGLASMVMCIVGEHIRSHYELGALCTGQSRFYARFGWETWLGPTFVRVDQGWVRTKEEDGNVMILRTPTTPRLDLDAPISCEWRPGDVW